MASTTSSIKTTSGNLTGEKDSDLLMKSFSTYGRKSPRFTHVIDEMLASTRSEEGFPGCGGRQKCQRRGAINEHLKERS
jgi:hypothetical protein